ncbi:MAG: protein-export chaperone SecB [Holosporaceae bacterium]|jgi:preprotein translocase subunit SecB|nr:protein-export chaperone SecB [Holosporaceae bacterium]
MIDKNVSASDEPAQLFELVAQYLKDLSFEHINSGSQNQADQNQQPSLDVNLNVDTTKISDENGGHYNVAIRVKIEASVGRPLFIMELTYCGEYFVSGFPSEVLEMLLYVECPHLLFPFVRSIIASTTADGGFHALYLAPVNFAELYQRQRRLADVETSTAIQ